MISSRLLKADALPQRTTPVSFHFMDIEQECAGKLAAAEEQAQQLLLAAEEQAEQLRAEAEEIGHATGTVQAHADFEEAVETEVRRRVEQSLQQLIPPLQAATERLVRDREQILLRWETDLVRLGLTLAERILRREIEVHPAPPFELVAEALQLTAGSASVLLRMHPHDIAEVNAHSDDWQQLLSTQQSLKVVADPQVSRGGCLLETAVGEIDGRIETQLARIADELLGTTHE